MKQLLATFVVVSAGFVLAVLPAAAQSSGEERIRELDQRWNEALAEGDVEFITDLYADGAMLMPPGAPAGDTQEEIRTFWSNLIGMPGFSLDIQPSTVTVAESGDMAYEIGTFELGFDSNQGRVEDQGKYVVVWRKTGDEWKVAADIFNSDGTE